MIRDGVCDEATNVERCLFDGGDCCLGNKSVWNCNFCTCKLSGIKHFFDCKTSPKSWYFVQ